MKINNMLSFLRKIRRSLIDSRSGQKYLLYAIGEIILVVLGILIALQINNQNEWRKERKVEREILIQLDADLRKTLGEQEFDWRLQKGFLNSTWNVLGYIENPTTVFVDSMAYDFVRWSFDDYSYPILNAYERIRSGNSRIIRNDSLLNMIHHLYEDIYSRLSKIGGYYPDIEEVMYPYIQKHFTQKAKDLETYQFRVDTLIEKGRSGTVISLHQHMGYIPKDFEFLKLDPEFRLLLHKSIRMRGYKLGKLRESITETENILKMIEIELKTKK